MRLALDTNRYVDFARGDKVVVEALECADEILVPLIVLDEQTTHHYSAVFRQLRQQGTPIPTNDMWIAALTLQHGLMLYSRDRHFDHLPQLLRL